MEPEKQNNELGELTSFLAPDSNIGCIEGGYAIIYIMSLYALGLNLYHWLHCAFAKTIADGRAIPEVLLIICIALSVVQFCRIYHYVHLFDRYHESKYHFVARLNQPFRFFDRLLRWGAGLCVIYMLEEKALHVFLGHGVDNGVPAYSSLETFPKLLLVTFALLFTWDISFLVWRRFNLKIIKDDANLKKSIEIYEPGRKMSQRFFGIVFSLCLSKHLENPTSKILPYIFGGSLILFLISWMLDYIPPRWRFWSKEQREKPREACGNIFKEIGSPFITIYLLFFKSPLSNPVLVTAAVVPESESDKHE